MLYKNVWAQSVWPSPETIHCDKHGKCKSWSVSDTTTTHAQRLSVDKGGQGFRWGVDGDASFGKPLDASVKIPRRGAPDIGSANGHLTQNAGATEVFTEVATQIFSRRVVNAPLHVGGIEWRNRHLDD